MSKILITDGVGYIGSHMGFLLVEKRIREEDIIVFNNLPGDENREFNGLYWLLLKGKIFRGYNLERVQDFYAAGFYHRHFRPNVLPRKVVDWMKRKWGWLLVAEFEK